MTSFSKLPKATLAFTLVFGFVHCVVSNGVLAEDVQTGFQSDDLAPPDISESLPTAPSESPQAAEAEPPKPIRKPASDDYDGNNSAKTNSNEERINPFIPRFQQTRPQWAIIFNASLKALGTQPVLPGQGTYNLAGYNAQFEFQPAFLQRFGILSFGPSLSIYPITSNANVTKNALSIWSYGGQIRYQARFLREQWVVPTVSYNFENLNYNLNGGTQGRMYLTGITYGGMFLLNVVDEDAASQFYINYTVSRSYLVAEFRSLSGSDANITLVGSSLFFGLRIEY